MPLIVDAHCAPKQKAIWFPIVMLGSPIGQSLGQVLTGILISKGIQWQISFYIIATLFIISTMVTWLLPNRLVNLDQVRKYRLALQKS